jgi:glycosyltransferase involved in cell wall biosynthesis
MVADHEKGEIGSGFGNKFGAVAIGRNEGERLQRCLQSLTAADCVVYVDSGSSDGSVQHARNLGLEVVELDMRLPFTAARARNAGFKRLREKAPDIRYVQYVDGDCEVRPHWPQCALAFLEAHKDVAVVCGRRRERYPERSVYNWLCDQEWSKPAGEVGSCGGDAMMRVVAVEATGGYRDDMIAGEEPEFCLRLRAAGWRIWRLTDEMTLHDAAMTRFAQWWRRTMRSGYAFAQGAYLHGASPERHWVWEARRAWIWGIWLPFACLIVGLVFDPWGWAIWLVFPAQAIRQTIRNRGSIRDRTRLAFFELLGRFPESWGQLRFLSDRFFGRRSQLLEYK